ncbi:MAG: ATP-binding domain-containing protein, partial [Bacteroidaceae bacterium]|nr:ATP-binding domain-containing protein [Bacteroidaceae bacterium]
VTLMTVHAAKGLEFDAVFIVGLEEHLFPSDMSGDDERQIEEERRLLYVAMTRARKYLYLLFATTRFKYGSVDFCTPSRFLRDIDPRYLNTDMSSGGVKAPWTNRPVPSEQDSRPQFRRYQDRRPPEPQKQVIKPWQQGKFQKVTESMLRDSEPAQSSTLKTGDVIEHERFGIGSVISVEGSGENAKARIRFQNVGEKTLLLKFARYKLLSQ